MFATMTDKILIIVTICLDLNLLTPYKTTLPFLHQSNGVLSDLKKENKN